MLRKSTSENRLLAGTFYQTPALAVLLLQPMFNWPVLLELLKYVMSCHVAVPSSTTLAIMRCQSPLSPEALMSCVGLTLSFNESHRLSSYSSIGF